MTDVIQPQTEVKKKPRILTFDLLRGYLIVSIILNHLQWYPNGFDLLAMRGSLLVSTAEGFFFLSGLVLGIVRGRKLLARPFRMAASLLLKRGTLLYVTSVTLAFLFTLVGWWFFMDNPGLKPGIRPPDEPVGDVIFGIMSLNYLYGWADFLRLYTVFIIAAPFALWLMRKGLWYVVFAVSVGVWALFPWALEHGPRDSEILMLLSWQLVFFGGFIIGFYWEKLSDFWSKLRPNVRRSIPYPVLSVAALTLLANIAFAVGQHYGLLTPALSDWYSSIQPYFNKHQLPVARLALFLLWFVLGFYVVQRFEAPIKKYAGWILLPFGQNSLYVYIVHAVLLFFAHQIMPPDTSINILTGFLGATLILSITFLAVKKEFLFKIIPR